MKKLLALSFTVLILNSCATAPQEKKQIQPPPIQETKTFTRKEKADGFYKIGVSYLQLGDIPLALNYLFKAKDLNPKDPKIYNMIGYTFYVRGDVKRAKKYINKALNLDPKFSEAYMNLATIAEEEGNLKEAKKYYLKALENPLFLNPEVAYYKLALIEEKEGNLTLAKRHLTLAIRNNLDFAPAYVELGKLLEKEEKQEEAKELYYQIIKRFPKLQEAYYRLALIYLNEKNLPLAEKFIKKCYKINPDSRWGIKAQEVMVKYGFEK
ncbi:tetratricopeptide repeat protein [Desulfurobacterium atlanticum]|uniref:Tfp pilus assembly protein PilF n=1 Tax=Desulfurobacterium atlanticum TaxID=240169 RepID=A0A238ZD81_9BACT|nr:tetratricopeptide repeat protein [Desulfurobacterium atlanticum]SNR81486.1 Tfp pilus assembly protein PilF [Desulfurobacterium atlanticum]